MAPLTGPGRPRRPDAKSVENKRAPADADRRLGAKIRRLRRTAGMTLKDLAATVGVSCVQLQRYEVGTSRVAASRLLAISEALDVRADILLGQPPTVLADWPADGHDDDVIALVRLFRDIPEPAHRQAIMTIIRAVVVPVRTTYAPVGAYEPVLPISATGSIPVAGE